VTFTSIISNNNEGGTASFQYGPRYFYSNTSSPSKTASGAYSGEISTVANKSAMLAPRGKISNITQNIAVPANQGANYICGTVAFDPSSSRGDRNGRSTAICIKINHPAISCGTFTPPAVEPGQQFTFTGQLNTNSAAAINANAGPTFSVLIGTTTYSGASVVVSSSSTGYTLTVNNVNISSAGAQPVQWGISSAYGSQNCPGTIYAAYHPYFSVTGGDISAGDGDSTNGPEDIISWNTDNVGEDYAGAGSQLAALASGDITSFVTGAGLGSNPSSLAFANTATGGTKYGGGYDAGNTMPTVSTASASALGAGNLASLDGVYTHAGDITLSGTVPAGKNVTIILTSGNLYIDNGGAGGIKYAYGNLNQIPRLTVIVQNGNIYVNSAVTEVHGVFYAGGSGKGNFYSCATASGAVTTDYNTCNHPLTVYGAVTANKLVLNRSYGSLRASPGVPAAPAENFFYSPEVWLAPATTTSGSSSTIYNSYVSLPPIL
jgi:hypothetical protein